MTNTDICNMALSHIAKGKITSFNDGSESSRQCDIHYEHTRKMLLRGFSWGFAKRIVPLARLDVETLGWNYTYAYPEQCLNIRYVFNEKTAKNKIDEKEEFDIVLVSNSVRGVCCNTENAYAEYLYDVTDPNMFSAEFVEALSRILASNISLALTGNANIQQMQYQLYQVAIQQAKLSSAREREKEMQYPRRYADARFN